MTSPTMGSAGSFSGGIAEPSPKKLRENPSGPPLIDRVPVTTTTDPELEPREGRDPGDRSAAVPGESDRSIETIKGGQA